MRQRQRQLGVCGFIACNAAVVWHAAEQGFFTKILIEGLRGDAAARGEKVISTGDLDTWLDRWVPGQSSGLQTAVMFK
jgi:hypothetical protein